MKPRVVPLRPRAERAEGTIVNHLRDAISTVEAEGAKSCVIFIIKPGGKTATWIKTDDSTQTLGCMEHMKHELLRET